MTDFKPGDEVVCIWSGPWRSRSRIHNIWMTFLGRYPRKGQTYTVALVGGASSLPTGVGLDLVECPAGKLNGRQQGWCASKFRKVQRRDLSVWLATKNTIEAPKRVPATEDV